MPYAGNVRHEQNVLIARFRELGAIDESSAVTADQLGIRPLTLARTRVLSRLVEAGIAEQQGDLYFLHDDRAQDLLDNRGVVQQWRTTSDS